MPKAYVIGIAGPSCSGKTTTANALAHALGGAPVIPMDSYYRNFGHEPMSVRERINWDHPEVFDFEYMRQQIEELAAGQRIERPIYDYSTHSRFPHSERIEPSEFVIIEGLFALHWPELRQLIHTAVYMEAKDGICHDRRLYRDVHERARTPESIERQYRETVRPMAEQFIFPTRSHAHLIVDGTAPVEGAVVQILKHIESQRGR